MRCKGYTFCAPTNVLTILWQHRTGGVIASVSISLVGNYLPPVPCSYLCTQSIVKILLVQKTCFYLFGRIAYKSKKRVDASQADLKQRNVPQTIIASLHDTISYPELAILVVEERRVWHNPSHNRIWLVLEVGQNVGIYKC